MPDNKVDLKNEGRLKLLAAVVSPGNHPSPERSRGICQFDAETSLL